MAYVTIRDIAHRAGVSVAAVSQILHGKGRFSDETRQMVLNTAREMEYVPDRRARAMRSSETKTIGLLVPDLRNPYFADLVSSMEDELHDRGYTTLIGTSAENTERQDAFIANLLGQRIDGALIVPQGVESAGIRMLVGRDLPLVFVDRRVPGVDAVPFVVSDPYPGIEQAVKALIAFGHRRIGFISHASLGSFNVNERETAFRTVASRLLDGDGDVVTLVDCDSSYESHQMALDRMLAEGITAIIGAYSPDMITVIGLLHDKGIDIGVDISVVSFDDIAAFRLMTPQIAVISQQVEVMGRQGVAMLLEAIDSSASSLGTGQSGSKCGTGDRDPARYVPTVFISRGSVGQMRSACPLG